MLLGVQAHALSWVRPPLLPAVAHMSSSAPSPALRIGAVSVLRRRGLLAAVTADALDAVNPAAVRAATGRSPAVYAGFDPTAPSLHLGNLVVLVALKHFQAAGFRPVLLVGALRSLGRLRMTLRVEGREWGGVRRAGDRCVRLHTPPGGFSFMQVGGATALIGDPSGRVSERPLLDMGVMEKNAAGIRESLGAMFHVPDGDDDTGPVVVNNLDFYSSMTAIQLIRDVGRWVRDRRGAHCPRGARVVNFWVHGRWDRPPPPCWRCRHFRMHSMLNRDSVRNRLSMEAGLSFTEFSYQLFQSHDFGCLAERHGCIAQLGGSDQWGNITAGVDYVRRTQEKVHAQAHHHHHQQQQQQQQQQQPLSLSLFLLLDALPLSCPLSCRRCMVLPCHC
jgi:tyrosyl-tRNA synthetase